MNAPITCCRIEADDDLIKSAKTMLCSDNKILRDKAKLFSLLGNEVRLKIVTLFLSYTRMCVCDLADVLEMKQSPISQHLRKLKDAGVLDNKREGMTVFYFISSGVKLELEQLLKG
ncbi:MAG: hypothetical protein SPLUMA1_SPLUMAMAG1_01733 [uncultured Sulfurimonas sp.]|nr:MAG: hypothetical protein SPLUMA1_SPLUMAMAG1_01733 [uncultured Sulfurimonas sp.]